MHCLLATTAFAAGTGDVAGAVESTWTTASGQIKSAVNKVVFPAMYVCCPPKPISGARRMFRFYFGCAAHSVNYAQRFFARMKGRIAMTYDNSPHRLELDGRERLTVSGVEDVDRFDENEIVMTTSAGTLIVQGESLHIDKLSLDGGELHVDGRIDSVSYEDVGGGRGGLLSRLFGG